MSKRNNWTEIICHQKLLGKYRSWKHNLNLVDNIHAWLPFVRFWRCRGLPTSHAFPAPIFFSTTFFPSISTSPNQVASLGAQIEARQPVLQAATPASLVFWFSTGTLICVSDRISFFHDKERRRRTAAALLYGWLL
jgi:hypothetical protein